MAFGIIMEETSAPYENMHNSKLPEPGGCPSSQKDLRFKRRALYELFVVFIVLAAIFTGWWVFSRGVSAVLAWYERDWATGGTAYGWLDQVFSNEWNRNPFPLQSITAIKGMRQGFAEKDYWLRVHFKTTFGQVIMSALHNDLRKHGSNRIVFKYLVRASLLDRPPSFWRPETLGVDAIEVDRYNAHPPPTGPARGTIIYIAPSKGVAYIYQWQL